jgi:hypothetical protein
MQVRFTSVQLQKLQWLVNADRGWAAALVILARAFPDSRRAWQAVVLDGPAPYFEFEAVLEEYWSSTERYLLQFAAHFAHGRASISLYHSLQYLDDSQVAKLLEAIQVFRGAKLIVATDLMAVKGASSV